MRKADNVIRIPASLSGSLFRFWFEFLKPFHNLPNRDIEVIACLVKHRHELSKVITDPELLDRVALGEDTKRRVREECNMTVSHFQVVLSRLKKGNIIINGKINPKFIPNIVEENGNFQLLLLFDFS